MSSGPPPHWRVVITPRAEKELKRLPAQDQARIRTALDALAAGPGLGSGDITKLTGEEDEWRLRVGRWRVRFRPDFPARVIVVLHVLPRGSAYQD